MKIIILGAGQVGTTLALNLEGEDNDITLIDTDSKRLRDIQDHLDLRTIVGHGAYPDVLYNAGIEDADMLVAVTNSDEVNMIACQIACTRPPLKLPVFAHPITTIKTSSLKIIISP